MMQLRCSFSRWPYGRAHHSPKAGCTGAEACGLSDKNWPLTVRAEKKEQISSTRRGFGPDMPLLTCLPRSDTFPINWVTFTYGTPVGTRWGTSIYKVHLTILREEIEAATKPGRDRGRKRIKWSSRFPTPCQHMKGHSLPKQPSPLVLHWITRHEDLTQNFLGNTQQQPQKTGPYFTMCLPFVFPP